MLEARRVVDVGEVAGEVVGRLGRRFPAIVITLRVDERVEAEVAGGAAQDDVAQVCYAVTTSDAE